MLEKAIEKFPTRGVIAHGWIGVNSITGFDGLAFIVGIEAAV